MALLVVETGTLTCSFGTAPCKFKVIPTNVTGEKKNAANIMDNVYPTNVPGFTLCTSPSNPAVAAALGVPQACTPVFPAPWAPGKPNVILRDQPALDNNSILMCVYAGVISVTDPGETKVTLE
ncbi:MAG: DUF4280 domain-containing protein [Alphaproteobacteria bacterium]|nr:DUF4280 domain-containing protein [Alphaproteobacteria bacterium]